MGIMWVAVGVWMALTCAGIIYGVLTKKPDTFAPRCQSCGQYGPTPLRYRHIKSGSRYCSQECVEKDPNWPDEDMWINA